MKSRKRHNVFRFRWSIPILSEISQHDGARFVTILNRIGISRSVLSSTLNKLVEDGLVMRNPGYGHPLRPEYLLTPDGRKIAPFCEDLLKCLEERKALRLVQSRWALRILFLLVEPGIRFSELRASLAPITPRALSEELKLLGSEGYVTRAIIDDYPPITIYELTQKTKPIISILERNRENIPDLSYS